MKTLTSAVVLDLSINSCVIVLLMPFVLKMYILILGNEIEFEEMQEILSQVLL